MENQVPASFSARLRTLRKTAHLTQEDVAARLNIHRTTYTKYETAKASPDQACLLQLAEMFHVTVDYLLGKEASPDTELQDGTAVLTLNAQEQAMLALFRQLPVHEQKNAQEYVYRLKRREGRSR